MFDQIVDAAMLDMAAKKEIAVKIALGIYAQPTLDVSQTFSVMVRKPRWMPDRTFRWLLRRVVVVEGPLRSSQTG